MENKQEEQTQSLIIYNSAVGRLYLVLVICDGVVVDAIVEDFRPSDAVRRGIIADYLATRRKPRRGGNDDLCGGNDYDPWQ